MENRRLEITIIGEAVSINPINEIIRFQTDRNLDKNKFDTLNENTSIAEEMFEAHGYDIAKEDRPKLKEAWDNFVTKANFKKKVKRLTKDMVADAYCDIIVFCVGALLKLGYDPNKALHEAAKEINSRVGTMHKGKFEKDLSPEAKAKWYIADYSKAKL